MGWIVGDCRSEVVELEYDAAKLAGAVTVAAWAAAEVWQASRRRPEATNDDRHSRLVVHVSLIVGCLAATWATTALPGTSIGAASLLVWVGIVVAWVGILVRWWSFRVLGRYFTVSVATSPDQPVISSGPYRLLRHPSYAGLLLVMLGVGLMLGNWVGLAEIVIVPALGLGYRIRVEESAMAAALGHAYEEFASTRKRVIPYLW